MIRRGACASSTYTITMTIDDDDPANGPDGEMDVEVTGSVTPFVRGRTHGDPGNWTPDEGGEIEILKVTEGAREIELTAEQEERAQELLREAAADDDGGFDEDRDDDREEYDYADAGDR